MTGTATSELSKNSWKTSLAVRDFQLEKVPEVKVLMFAEPPVTISEAAMKWLSCMYQQRQL
jgi:hypothetical protein